MMLPSLLESSEIIVVTGTAGCAAGAAVVISIADPTIPPPSP